MTKIKLNQKGAILIEAILALTVIVVLMTALVSALVSSLSNSNFSKNQTVATGYAQEGLEYTRNIRDSDYGTFLRKGENEEFCLDQNLDEISIGTCGPSSYINGIYKRVIYVFPTGRDSRQTDQPQMCVVQTPNSTAVFVVSTVSWTDSKCSDGDFCHKVELNACFANLDRISF